MSGRRHAILCAALAAIALLCVVTAPATAWAAMVCSEPSVAESMPEPEPADEAPWTLLEIELTTDDTIALDRDQAPMSLTEGASAVAPRAIHRTSDARIEASQRCDDEVGAQELVSPDERHPLEPPSPVMAASLTALPRLPTAPAPRTLDFLPPSSARARGVRHDVERPPRR